MCPAATDIASQWPIATGAPSPVPGGSPVSPVRSSNLRDTRQRQGQSRSRFPEDFRPEASETFRVTRETPRSWRSFSRRPCPCLRGRAPLCILLPGPTSKSFRKRRQEFRQEFPPRILANVLAEIVLGEPPRISGPAGQTPKTLVPPRSLAR